MVIGSRTSRDGCMLSACPIFVNNASLWKTLQATILFYLMYVCVFIYRNDSLLMKIYKYEKNIIRLDALVSMRDVVSILLEEKHILIHCLVKMRAKIPLFSLNVRFCRMPPLKSTMTSSDVL